jgi:hypothetical protein
MYAEVHVDSSFLLTLTSTGFDVIIGRDMKGVLHSKMAYGIDGGFIHEVAYKYRGTYVRSPLQQRLRVCSYYPTAQLRAFFS